MVEAIPGQFLSEDDAELAIPKRGRGRPAGSTNKPRDGSTPARAKTPTKTEIKRTCASIVGGLNLVLAFTKYKDDCLDEKEMDMLSDALVAECQTSDRIVSWLTRAGVITPHLLLLKAGYMIAVPRLQRRGMMPMNLDDIPPHEPEQCNSTCPIHAPAAMDDARASVTI